MARNCENWLSTFREWCLPVSEAPETFIYYTGLFTLASALRRRVFIPKKYMGSYDIYPNLYVLFVGPAGGPRKSTSANASEILKRIPGCTKGPELVSKEALLNRMVKEDRENAIYVLAPEFGEFIAKSGLSMYGFLTNIYDGKADLGDVTLSRGTVFAEKPCINLLGATTREWIAENMPISIIGGGFASRVISIYEETVRRRRLFYTDVDIVKQKEIEDKLIDDLAHLAVDIKGEFGFESKETEDWTENWYQKQAGKQTSDQYKLSGYFNRKHVHVLKLAMLIHLAYDDELSIRKSDIEEAIKVMESVEASLPKVYEHIGKNLNTNTLQLIKQYVTEKKQVSSIDLKRKFLHAFQSGDDLIRNISTLCELNEIQLLSEDGTLYYTPYTNGKKGPSK